MINKPLSVAGQAKKEYELLPKDVYQVELLDVELKEQLKYQSQETEEVLNFTFVIVEDGKFYGRRIWQTCSQKLVGGKKQSHLYRVMSAFMGREFSPVECEDPMKFLSGDVLNSLIGKQLRLSMGQKVSEQTGKTKNFIESFLPVKSALPAYNKDKTVETEPTSVTLPEEQPLPDM